MDNLYACHAFQQEHRFCLQRMTARDRSSHKLLINMGVARGTARAETSLVTS